MKYKPKQKKLWEKKYINGKNVPTIAKQESVPASTIYGHLHSVNVKMRSDAGRQRKYNCNDEYFSKIDTPNKAYWLGLITADGWIAKNRGAMNILGLGLKYEDRGHVENFKKELEAENPVLITGKDNYASIRICSTKLCKDLSVFGIIPNKTKTIKPTTLDSNLENHYWRGIVDGDGVVNAYKNRHGYEKAHLELYGNYYIVKGFSEYVKSFCKTKTKPRQKDTNVWRIGYTNRIAAKVIKNLYNNNNMALKRKKYAAQKALKKQSINHLKIKT